MQSFIICKRLMQVNSIQDFELCRFKFLEMINKQEVITKQKKDSIHYREMRATDMPKILKLWEESSGWGAITKDQFNSWYLDTPYGPCLTAVAEGVGGAILGQLIFAPTQLVLNGKSVKVLKALAPILHEKLRKQNLIKDSHPIVKLIKVGNSIASKRGFHLIYSFPAHAWLGLFKSFPRFGLPECQSQSFNCQGIAIQKRLKPSGYSVKELSFFTNEVNALWEDAIIELPINCAIIRDQHWLNWKWGDHFKFGMYNQDGLLMGYVVIDRSTYLIKDVLAKSEGMLHLLINQVLDHLYDTKDQYNIKQVKVMYTSLMARILKGLSLEAIDYRFAFNIYSISAKYEVASLHADEWYMMPND